MILVKICGVRRCDFGNTQITCKDIVSGKPVGYLKFIGKVICGTSGAFLSGSFIFTIVKKTDCIRRSMCHLPGQVPALILSTLFTEDIAVAQAALYNDSSWSLLFNSIACFCRLIFDDVMCLQKGVNCYYLFPFISALQRSNIDMNCKICQCHHSAFEFTVLIWQNAKNDPKSYDR